MENITLKAQFLFELKSKQDWINNVPAILPKKFSRAEQWVWVDKNGFVFTTGRDFSASEKQNSFPCKVYKLIRVAENPEQ
jgi:hypothetical protein